MWKAGRHGHAAVGVATSLLGVTRPRQNGRREQRPRPVTLREDMPMTQTARDLLAAFEALDPPDKREVAVEILRRSAGVEELPDEGFDELAADIFRNYDVEEKAGADH
jgi:hypothetical protein